jgi:type VI secretion system secreted protein Hcp
MAFDAFCYSVDGKPRIPGETQDDEMLKLGAFEVLSFELGAENTINIGSISGGGGAGKATFKEFTVTKKTDTASAGLFIACVSGDHFNDMVVLLRRAAGVSGSGASGVTFMKFEMRLVMVQDISWSGSDGDDVCEETVIFQFGAIEVTYIPQDKSGKMLNDSKKQQRWSRVKNNASLTV